MWFFNGDNAISQSAKLAISDPSAEKYISMVSVWELAIKISLGKLDFAGRSAGFVALADGNGFTVMPIKTSHLVALETLPMIHRDPFDRLLVATAVADGMTIITADENIALYDVPRIW